MLWLQTHWFIIVKPERLKLWLWNLMNIISIYGAYDENSYFKEASKQRLRYSWWWINFFVHKWFSLANGRLAYCIVVCFSRTKTDSTLVYSNNIKGPDRMNLVAQLHRPIFIKPLSTDSTDPHDRIRVITLSCNIIGTNKYWKWMWIP